MSSSTGITSRTVYGSRLMPVVVDEISKQQPDLVFGTVPLTTNISDGFRDVTFSDIASATNFLATWIDKTLGRSSSFETIAYMGLGDLRYVVVFLAAVKCGYKVRPISSACAWHVHNA
jgi:acyl-CoA synthetase (AMP-forming)/AMP-acid ligase II